MMIRNIRLVLGALLVAPSVAFVPASIMLSSTSLASSTEGRPSGAGMPSFSLVPDQGTGSIMDPRYQIQKQSVYPPAMHQQRAAFASEAGNSFIGTNKDTSSSVAKVDKSGAGMPSFSLIPDQGNGSIMNPRYQVDRNNKSMYSPAETQARSAGFASDARNSFTGTNQSSGVSTKAQKSGAGMPSFSLVPDQGNGSIMNPRYQIDKQSTYPPAMQARKAAFAAEARNSNAGTNKIIGGGAGMPSFRSAAFASDARNSFTGTNKSSDVSKAEKSGAGMPSFSLVPDQGSGSIMNPRYQVDRNNRSVYETRNSFFGTNKSSDVAKVEKSAGAGMPSFSLVPDQGNGTTMNPRYQIEKQSIYPPAMRKIRPDLIYED